MHYPCWGVEKPRRPVTLGVADAVGDPLRLHPPTTSPVLTRIFTRRQKRSSVRAAHLRAAIQMKQKYAPQKGMKRSMPQLSIAVRASATVAPGVAGGAVRQQRLGGAILPVPGELVPNGIDRRTSRRGHPPDVAPSDRRLPSDSQQPRHQPCLCGRGSRRQMPVLE